MNPIETPKDLSQWALLRSKSNIIALVPQQLYQHGVLYNRINFANEEFRFGGCSIVCAYSDGNGKKIAARFTPISKATDLNEMHAQIALQYMLLNGYISHKYAENILQTLSYTMIHSQIIATNEYMDVDLFDYINQYPKNITITAACTQHVLLQILHGVAALHITDDPIPHGDIKIENIMLSPYSTNFFDNYRRWLQNNHARNMERIYSFNQILPVKIIDFSSSILSKMTSKQKQSHTPDNQSPTRVLADPKPSLQDDIWALGVVFYTIITGCQSPFNENWREMCKENQVEKQKQYLELVSKRINERMLPLVWNNYRIYEFQTLLSGMLNMDPTMRLTMKQILSHPFFG